MTCLRGAGCWRRLRRGIERAVGRLPRRVFVLTSPEIWALWNEAFCASFAKARIEPPIVLFLPPGERHKTMASVERLTREMVRAGGDRGSLLIAFGGGIVGDVGGFVAAVFMRGIRICAGADDVSGASGLERGRQGGREPARGQESGREFFAAAGGVCRYWRAGHAARPRVARRADGEREGGHHSRPGAGAVYGRARGRDSGRAMPKHWSG